MPLPRFVSAPHIQRGRAELALLLALVTLLELAAGVGPAYLAGFSRVRAVVSHPDWVWLPALAAALAVSFVGYYHAYQGIFRVAGGPGLPARRMRAVVAAGFGGFLSHGAGALDRYALRAAGTGEHDARARAAALAGLEQGVLAIGGCGAAIAVLVSGLAVPTADFTLPWAVIPVPGLLVAFWAAGRYRDRYRGQAGWHGILGTFLDAVHLIRELFLHPRPWAPAVLGMALFWAADVFAVWAGLAAFGLRMSATALVVGYSTGMVFTRRTGPLAGAGILTLVLPLTLWYSGAPLAVAAVGVFAYRALSFWLPLPASLAVMPVLRAMAEDRIRRAESGARPDAGRAPRVVPGRRA